MWAADMMPLSRRGELHDGRDPIAHERLKATRASHQPAKHNSAVRPSKHFVRGDVEYFLNMVEEIGQKMSSAQLQTRHSQPLYWRDFCLARD